MFSNPLDEITNFVPRLAIVDSWKWKEGMSTKFSIGKHTLQCGFGRLHEIHIFLNRFSFF